MSLYTPVFPPFHEANSSQKDSHGNSSVAPLAKHQNYVKHLRDVHLFLSTQSDVLSPPSRPSSPMFDLHVQKVKDKIHDIFNTTGAEISSGKWTRASQILKLGCARGRHWSLSQVDPCALEQDANWILPDEESEWVEWEKKREENRRLKAKTNASQPIGIAVPPTSDSQPSHASFTGPSQPSDTMRSRCPPGVSPKTLRVAREKVKKWRESMASDAWHDMPRGSSPASARDVVAGAEGKRETAKPQRSRTLDFAVVKPGAKSLAGKTRKGYLSQPVIHGDSVPVPSPKVISPKSSKTPDVSQDAAPVDVDKMTAKEPAKTPTAGGDKPRIANVPETVRRG